MRQSKKLMTYLAAIGMVAITTGCSSVKNGPFAADPDRMI